MMVARTQAPKVIKPATCPIQIHATMTDATRHPAPLMPAIPKPGNRNISANTSATPASTNNTTKKIFMQAFSLKFYNNFFKIGCKDTKYLWYMQANKKKFA